MLKVVLADDEEIIREGILYGINWEQLGMQVVGQAEDGEQAIELVDELRPDIIITDIKMPFVNGLEFIEKIRPKHPGAYIIIISGHDEFGYARKAIQLGAYDYILKPIELDYLEGILNKVSTDYETRVKKEVEICELQEKVAENLPLQRERLLRDIIFRRGTPEELAARANSALMDFEGHFYSAMIIQMDDYYATVQGMEDSEVMQLEACFHEMVKSEAAEANTIAFEDKTCHSIVCMADDYRETLKDRIIRFSSRLRERLNKQGAYTVTAAVGNIHGSVLGLAESYKEAAEALNHKFVVGGNRNIFHSDVKAEAKNQYYSVDYNDTELVALIKSADKKAIEDKLSSLVKEIKENGSSSYLYMQIVVGSIYMQALRILRESGGTAEEVFTNPIEVYNRVVSHQTVEGMMKELLDILYRITDYISLKRNGKYSLIMERVKEYIRKNFSRDDLSLEEVANYANISVCYFSVLFKQEMGETFVDYLTKVRIEKAKELLTVSNYKTYEISYQVGYNNPTYFSTTFKKCTGLSPTEYRDSKNTQR